MMPAISVIIPTCDRVPSLLQTLETVYNQSIPAHVYEVLIVENGPKSEAKVSTTQLAGSYPNHTTRYLHEPIPGLLAGRHRGAAEATGEILVFADDDIDAAPGWLQAIADSFADERTDMVGGRNLPRYEVPEPSWVSFYWWTSPYGGAGCGPLSLLDFGEKELVIDPIFIWGLNFSIRRDVLFELGGFHPDNLPDQLQHFQGDGETGLSLKARAKGARAIYQPRAMIHHRVSAERLTCRYFERRQFYQGVCDSYTSIRKDPTPSVMQKFAVAGEPTACKESEWIGIATAVRAAYDKGFEFHQRAVESSPALLEWVLKDDYWDYRLPSVDTKWFQLLRSEILAAPELR
jgi:glycosyltransferase involved in cell wall biosynthesis